MNSISFWNNFQKPTKFLYLLSLIILAISLIILDLAYFKGLENVIHWDVLSELGEVPIILDQFKVGEEILSIPSKTFTVTEQFVASPMAINTLGNYLFLGLFMTGFLIILSATSALRRFWYLIFMGSVILLIVTFNLSLVFNLSDNYTNLGAIILYIGTSYFFHAFRPDIDILKRFFTFLFITVLVGISIHYFSKVVTPFLLLSSYRTSGAMFLSIGFIFLISYEIINGFLIITTSSKGSKQLLNFLIISFIYLVNVLLVFLYNNKTIDWNMIYLSPFLLLIISIILGIWGFKQRRNLSIEVMDFEESGAFIYIGLSIITLATCGLAFATGNDPMVEVFEDAVTYSHLGMGIMFLVYVILNFSSLFRDGLEVYKVVFKPFRYPIWMFRIMALIMVGGLLLFIDFFPVNQFSAANYNALGDYYATEKDYKFAEIEYKIASSYEPRNHKTNYALASLALNQGDNETAGVYFRKATAKNPSPFDYEGLSRSLSDGDQFFNAIFVLKEGVQKFPKSGELQNNLAYLYNKSKLPDSTLIYYDMAIKNAKKPEVPASNLLAFWANNLKEKGIEEVLDKTEDIKYNSFQANKLAIAPPAPNGGASIMNLDSDAPPLGAGGASLSVSNFALIYNLSLRQKSKGKSLPLRRLAESEDNESLSEDLLFANALQDYYQGDKLIAFQNFQAWSLGDSTDKKGKYYALLLNTLLKKEKAESVFISDIKNPTGQGLKRYPLNENVVEKVVEIFNKNKQPEKAYDAISKAIAWRKDSPKLYELYIIQALNIGMKDYATDGLTTLKKLSPTDYQRFLPTYQAKLQSIEKAGVGFK